MVKTLVNNPATYTEERYNAAHIHIHIESVLCVKIFCSLNTSENTLLSSLRKTCDITSKHNYPSGPHWEKNPLDPRMCTVTCVVLHNMCISIRVPLQDPDPRDAERKRWYLYPDLYQATSMTVWVSKFVPSQGDSLGLTNRWHLFKSINLFQWH